MFRDTFCRISEKKNREIREIKVLRKIHVTIKQDEL